MKKLSAHEMADMLKVDVERVRSVIKDEGIKSYFNSKDDGFYFGRDRVDVVGTTFYYGSDALSVVKQNLCLT